MARKKKSKSATENVLSGATVYLSGPMDFVASRELEKKFGWRNRVGQFLRQFGTTVYDPWYQPPVKGMPHYGEEDVNSNKKRQNWSFADNRAGDRARAELGDAFWPSLHTDLRMTDTADFLICFIPTNIYSVGTVHEIVTARLQQKPVLFVSPPVTFPVYEQLEAHFQEQGDQEGLRLLSELAAQAPLRPNPGAMPSMWYMALVDAHYYFDGFGFAKYADKFGWEAGALDEHEQEFPPQRPLLPYLEKLNRKIPKRYDLQQDKYVENPEWLIFEDEDL
jgi:hypothetical protein